MADDGSAQSAAVWPQPKFRFQVKWGSNVLSFQEVSGLDVETAPIEYRAGSRTFAPVKMPGLRKFGNVTMKKGVFKGDREFWDWMNRIKLDTAQRVPVTITLLDESGGAAMAWTLANAWPAKISAPDLKADGNEVAIESIEISHEGLTLANG